MGLRRLREQAEGRNRGKSSDSPSEPPVQPRLKGDHPLFPVFQSQPDNGEQFPRGYSPAKGVKYVKGVPHRWYPVSGIGGQWFSPDGVSEAQFLTRLSLEGKRRDERAESSP